MAIYSVPISAVAVSATQTLFMIKASATAPLLLHEIRLGQKTLTAVEGKEIEWHLLTATVTSGSGGSLVTAKNISAPNGTASGATCRVNDTVSPTTTGTDTIVESDIWAFLNGYFWLPAPEDRIYIPPNCAFTLKLPTAPSASMTVSANLVYEELGV
jgi:hypothetical protein